MKKKIIAMLGLSLLVMSLTACGGKTEENKQVKEPVQTEVNNETATEETNDNPQEEVTLNVAYMPDYCALSGVVPAEKLGYFKDEGIKINLVQFADGPTIINAMEGGSIDVGYIGQGAHKLCINGRADIFALAHVDFSDGVVGSKKKGTDTLEKLKGKKVAYSSGTSSEDILVKGLKKAGLTMDDIQPIDMDPTSLVTAMLSGGVDACAAWVPNTTKIMKEMGDDAVKLCDNKDFLDETVSLASWICMPEYAKEHRDVLIRFARALYKGFDYRYSPEHQEQVCEWISDAVKLEKDTLMEQLDIADWTTSEFVRDHMDKVKEYYEIQQKSFVEKGDCKETPIDNYILFDVMEEATKNN